MAALCLGLEAAHRPDGIVAWLSEHPLEAFINGLMATAVGWAVLALVGRAWLATVLTAAPLVALTAGHIAKLENTGKPLYPWDVFLFREAVALAPYAAKWASPGVVLVGALLVVGGVVLERRWWSAVSLRVRVAAVVPVIVLAVALTPDPAKRLAPLRVQHLIWVQSDNYRVNGLLLAFTLNLPSTRVQRPPNYTREAVRAALSQTEPSLTTPEQPSVIVVMSESFFDVTRLEGLRFEPDPLPTLHRLQRESSSGKLYSPSFGGGTANTEFEVLTGHSMRFLPTGSVPYQQYLRRKQSSLASIYAGQGYRTAAIHTFHRWFWERESVYAQLGFDAFTGLEDMPDAGVDGIYPSDAELTQRIIEEVKVDQRPVFLFAISMEAHGPYEPGRYGTHDIGVDGPLDERAMSELSSYVESIHHADRELQALIDGLSALERPVVVVFFGDHLPSLPNVYRQLGVFNAQGQVDRADLQLRTRLHEVPLVMWTNTGELPRDLGPMSASFLGPLLLELTGTPGTRYTDFLRGVHQRMPVVLPGIIAELDGTLTEQMPEAYRGLESAWWTLEYDSLFGDEWLSQEPTEG